MSQGAGGEIRRSFYDPASRETSLGGQTAVCGRGHLEAASAGKQLRLHPASGLWRRPPGAALTWWSFLSRTWQRSLRSLRGLGWGMPTSTGGVGRQEPSPRGGAGGWPQGI